MQYPITFQFKIVALAPQIYVRDNTGNLLMYVKQKLFKLKEAINIFADEGQTRQIFAINADRMLDIGARYTITDSQGMLVGAIKQQGLRSLWKAHYDIFYRDMPAPVMTIREENPWVKVMDGLFGEIPILGIFSGYLFHPAYLVTRQDGTLVMRLEKRRAFLESTFTLEPKVGMHPEEEQLATLSLLMMILLERSRG
ncbi:MAG TPA: hypothetical protein VD886_24620 [Herpetosiphonaceae bacterium]|nr:hypothetical protein [Herpetosiphonaceae bacterium]